VSSCSRAATEMLPANLKQPRGGDHNRIPGFTVTARAQARASFCLAGLVRFTAAARAQAGVLFCSASLVRLTAAATAQARASFCAASLVKLAGAARAQARALASVFIPFCIW
jgi:hypothetical protein